MVCAEAGCIPRTAPAVAITAPTERKDLMEKYMITLSRFPVFTQSSRERPEGSGLVFAEKSRRDGTNPLAMSWPHENGASFRGTAVCARKCAVFVYAPR